MKKAIVIIIFVVILGLIFYRIATYQKGESPQSIEDIQKQQGVPVETLLIEPDTLVNSRQFSGTIEGYSQTSAVAHLMESVKEIRVSVGQRVSEGEVLAVLDNTNPQARYQQSELALNNARREFDRIKALYDKGAVSRQMLDQATLAKDIAQSNFANAKELVEITAPIDGIVTDVMPKPGEMVSPGDAVVTISNIEKIKSELWVGDADRQRIKPGQPAQFLLSGSNPETNNGQNIHGKVTEVALSADPESHLYKITVVADNSQGRLRPGQLVTVRIVTESIPNVLLIPQDAVVYQNNIPYVYKITNDHAQLTPITPGRKTSDQLEVTDGLTSGETIVVYGMNRLKSGDKIKVVSSPQEAVNVP